MKHKLHEWNIAHITYETSLVQHMKHHLCNIWNIIYVIYETSSMQHSQCNSHAYAYEWIDDAYAHEMQVQMQA
jgi:hypothetical protein